MTKDIGKQKRLKVGKMLTKQDKGSLFIMCYNVSINKESK